MSADVLRVWGIRECDSCRRALRWLAEHDIEHEFVDLRRDGVDGGDIERWLQSVEAGTLVNRRSTTWRQLDDADRERAMRLPATVLVAQPTLVKRPVFERGGRVLVGFRPDDLEAWLAD